MIFIWINLTSSQRWNFNHVSFLHIFLFNKLFLFFLVDDFRALCPYEVNRWFWASTNLKQVRYYHHECILPSQNNLVLNIFLPKMKIRSNAMLWNDRKNITSAAGGGRLCAEICGKIKTSPTQPQNKSDYIHSYWNHILYSIPTGRTLRI